MAMELERWRECWARAEAAADELRSGVARLGLEPAVCRRVRPIVTHPGRVYVDVGMLPEDAARIIARALGPERPVVSGDGGPPGLPGEDRRTSV
ncbi:hypothetical protein I3F58_03725 [Streptomyces sp. MUM 203J]|uniref:hypothetical protein n=1 Tax=Streptomyces sp. MUM 203J TaxID=2791990 RepID=UPI001F045718|nr:hypothetical protein [Streptomyces sp. MUM 203J]MCH0538683.1 hypothetical protein [Streptomyces sp. MUM 203J]